MGSSRYYSEIGFSEIKTPNFYIINENANVNGCPSQFLSVTQLKLINYNGSDCRIADILLNQFKYFSQYFLKFCLYPSSYFSHSPINRSISGFLFLILSVCACCCSNSYSIDSEKELNYIFLLFTFYSIFLPVEFDYLFQGNIFFDDVFIDPLDTDSEVIAAFEFCGGFLWELQGVYVIFGVTQFLFFRYGLGLWKLTVSLPRLAVGMGGFLSIIGKGYTCFCFCIVFFLSVQIFLSDYSAFQRICSYFLWIFCTSISYDFSYEYLFDISACLILVIGLVSWVWFSTFSIASTLVSICYFWLLAHLIADYKTTHNQSSILSSLSIIIQNYKNLGICKCTINYHNITNMRFHLLFLKICMISRKIANLF